LTAWWNSRGSDACGGFSIIDSPTEDFQCHGGADFRGGAVVFWGEARGTTASPGGGGASGAGARSIEIEFLEK